MEKRNSKTLDMISLIKRHFDFLESQYNYKVDAKIEESELYELFLIVEYSNEERKRNVRVTFSKMMIDNKVEFVFNLSILRTPYNDISDYFELAEFLKSHKIHLQLNIINEFSEDKANIILDKIVDAIKTNTLDILEGSNWLVNYYPKWD